MSYYSKFNKQVNKGDQAESIFKATVEAKGWYCHKTRPDDDKYRHIDFVIYNMNSKNYYTVDVKSKGRYGYTAELVNNFKMRGSLYGEADFIAYVESDKIILVNRKELVVLIEANLIDQEPITLSGTPKKYTKYTRPQWDDVWILLNIDDIYQIKHKIWRINGN